MNKQNKAKKPRTEDSQEGAPSSSKFEALFQERAQGFEMNFTFRNAPPRPPVGPCFVGLGIDGQLQESSQYHPTVELNYVWKLHSEPDLGVPLAPSAMDTKCYQELKTPASKLHPDDEALLNWTGSMGDTAAEQLKLKRDQARAAARLALKGKPVPAALAPTAPSSQPKKKKEFSRVLNENMPSFMKKTTYLANDFSRKVHDFVSLADTKQKTAQDLENKQARLDLDRSATTVSKSFQQAPILRHPTKPNLKPVAELAFLPNAQHWGQAYTHVVLDNPPKGHDPLALREPLDRAFVAHVEKQQANARMTCQLLIPENKDGEYRPIQKYDLDVVPLKEEDAPHSNFAIWVGEKDATYLPISSRVSLSTGRPVKQQVTNQITRRPASEQEKREFEERTAEVDVDMAKKIAQEPAPTADTSESAGEEEKTAASTLNPMEVDDDSEDNNEAPLTKATETPNMAVTAEG